MLCPTLTWYSFIFHLFDFFSSLGWPLPPGLQTPLLQDQASVCVRWETAPVEEGHIEQEEVGQEPAG